MTVEHASPVTAEANAAGVELSDVQRSLSLFAQGILGRPLHLRTVDTASRDGRLRSILNDGVNLHLPVRIDDYATPRENLGAYRFAVLHQIGYLQGGTFDFEPPDPQTGPELLRRRLNATRPDTEVLADAPDDGDPNSDDRSSLASMSLWRLPGIAARRPQAALERFFSNAPHPALLRRVFAIVEAIRIDARIACDYPGARADQMRVHRHALAQRPDPATMRPHIALVEALVQYSLGARFARRPADDPWSRILSLVTPLQRPGAGALDSAEVSLAICSLLAGVVTLRPIRRLRERPASGPVDGSGIDGLGGGDDGLDASGSISVDGTGEDADASEDDEDEEPAGDAEAPPGGGGDAPLPSQAQVDLDDLDDMGPGVAFHGVLAADLVQQARGPLKVRRTISGAEVPVMLPEQMAALDEAADSPDEPLDPEEQDSASRANAPRPPRRRGEAGAQRSFLYDEWDYLQQGYRKAWCRVLEERLHGDDADFIADVRRRHAMLTAQVRRQFSGVKPDAFRRVHKTPDGDEIELSSLLDAVIDRRAGHSSDESLYVRRERAQREVAAAFLVDMSASTDFPIPEPRAADADPATGANDGDEDPDLDNPRNHGYLYGGFQDWDELAPPAPKRRVMDVQKDAIALMCEALHGLGDSYAVYGFSGEGRHHVEFKLIKEFGDRLGARVWSAMGAMKPRRSTRMGPAIRHAASKLAREPARRKVLIIVSDGYPEDDDYGPERGDAEYGIRDTARALQEAENAGMTTFCITVDPAGHDYLRRMCVADRYLVIDDVSALPDELTKVYRTLTMTR